jgi:hypothetical protein
MMTRHAVSLSDGGGCGGGGGGIRPLCALVGAHGLTDLDSGKWLLPYAAFLLTPIPSRVITPLFCLLSLFHFSFDFSMWISAAVHLGALFVGARHGKTASARVMLLYLAGLHTPAHYRRCFAERRILGLWMAGVGSLLGVACSRRMGNTLEVTDFLQRVVCAHIWTEYRHARAVTKELFSPSFLRPPFSSFLLLSPPFSSSSPSLPALSDARRYSSGE